MITGEDIRRLEEEANQTEKKLLIIETVQFFEIEIPVDLDTHEFLESDTCRQICADKVLSGITDLQLEREETLNKESE